MNRPSWVPADVDLDRPNVARVYDFYLGGWHNFPVDREMGKRAIDAWPPLLATIQANRDFLRRAVRHALRLGVRQFLDLGAGIPTVGSVHEVARAEGADARIAYVDRDPVAVTQSLAILAGDPGVVAIRADLRQPEQVLADPEVTGLFDFTEPIALLMVAVLHFIPDRDDPAGIIRQYRAALPAGSLLVMSHATADGANTGQADEHASMYRRTDAPLTMRSRAEVAALFEGFSILDPGVVRLPLWRPDLEEEDPAAAEQIVGWAAMGRLS